MNIQAVVERLGFRPPEARVYVALVGMHEATVSDLARKVGMPRTTVQGIVEELQTRGLANFYTVRNRKLWCPESPRKLLSRHQELEKHLSELIPALEKLRPAQVNSIRTLHLEGRTGAKFVLEDIMASREEVAIYGNPEVFIDLVGATEWAHLIQMGKGRLSIARNASVSGLIITYANKAAMITQERDGVSMVVMHSSSVKSLIEGLIVSL